MGDEVVENKGTGSYFLGQFAHLGLSVKHVALGTTKLVWLLQRAPSLSHTMHILHPMPLGITGQEILDKYLPCCDSRRSSIDSQWDEHR